MSADPIARARDAIDRVDAALVSLVAERVRLAEALGAVKRAGALPLVDVSQEQEVLRRAAERASAAGLAPEPVVELFRALIAMARRAQGSEPDGGAAS